MNGKQQNNIDEEQLENLQDDQDEEKTQETQTQQNQEYQEQELVIQLRELDTLLKYYENKVLYQKKEKLYLEQQQKEKELQLKNREEQIQKKVFVKPVILKKKKDSDEEDFGSDSEEKQVKIEEEVLKKQENSQKEQKNIQRGMLQNLDSQLEKNQKDEKLQQNYLSELELEYEYFRDKIKAEGIQKYEFKDKEFLKVIRNSDKGGFKVYRITDLFLPQSEFVLKIVEQNLKHNKKRTKYMRKKFVEEQDRNKQKLFQDFFDLWKISPQIQKKEKFRLEDLIKQKQQRNSFKFREELEKIKKFGGTEQEIEELVKQMSIDKNEIILYILNNRQAYYSEEQLKNQNDEFNPLNQHEFYQGLFQFCKNSVISNQYEEIELNQKKEDNMDEFNLKQQKNNFKQNNQDSLNSLQEIQWKNVDLELLEQQQNDLSNSNNYSGIKPFQYPNQKFIQLNPVKQPSNSFNQEIEIENLENINNKKLSFSTNRKFTEEDSHFDINPFQQISNDHELNAQGSGQQSIQIQQSQLTQQESKLAQYIEEVEKKNQELKERNVKENLKRRQQYEINQIQQLDEMLGRERIDYLKKKRKLVSEKDQKNFEKLFYMDEWFLQKQNQKNDFIKIQQQSEYWNEDLRYKNIIRKQGYKNIRWEDNLQIRDEQNELVFKKIEKKNKLFQLVEQDLDEDEQNQDKYLENKGQVLYQEIVQKLIKDFDYYNEELINCGWKKTKQELDRIEIDLNNSQLFIEKIHQIKNKALLEQDYNQVQIKNNSLVGTQKDGEIKDDLVQLQPQQTILSLRNSLKIPQEKIKEENINEGSANIEPQSEFQVGNYSNTNLNISQIKNQNSPYFPSNSLLKEIEIEKSTSTVQIKHSKVAYDFSQKQENIFNNHLDFQLYHRYDASKYLLAKTSINFQKIQIMKINPNKYKNTRHTFNFSNEKNDYYEAIKDDKKLSCAQSDNVLFFEYMEENPLVLSNYGMTTKLFRYVRNKKVIQNMMNEVKKQITDYQQELSIFKQHIHEKLGELGAIKFLDDKQDIPNLIGKIPDTLIGISVLENDLFTAPVFKHKAPSTDFLLVKNNEKNEYFLRRIDHIYVVGQIEPKLELYTPQSRSKTNYIKQRIQQYLYHYKNKELSEVLRTFKGQNEQTIKAEFNKSQNKDTEINLEQHCLFEKMLNTQNELFQFGIHKIFVSDKMDQVIKQYIQKNQDDLEGYTISKLIQEELNITSWSLSQTYIKKAKMQIEGPGDPTNGHGGYSFLKQPIKIRSDKDEKKKEEAPTTPNKVESDYRKLGKDKLNDYLLKLGIKEEILQQQSRTEKRNLFQEEIKKLKGNAQKFNITQELYDEMMTFSRNDRLPQKEKDQKNKDLINEHFAKLISFLQSYTVTQQEIEIAIQRLKQTVPKLTLEHYISIQEPKFKKNKK